MIERIAIALVYLVGAVRLLPQLLALTVCLVFIWYMGWPVVRACWQLVGVLVRLMPGG